ncbi:MAG: hypothetical protein IE909_08655 [Campylobacterales bacterium]|nr:hypothetical protein [Campylobacterales bacterium]
MRSNFVEEVCDWNEARYNVDYDKNLEYRMLTEELLEYFNAKNIVDEADALADLCFVAIGSLYKLCGSDKTKVDDILLAVTSANNMKSSNKVNGKITKPANFIGPEDMIKKILER